MTGKPALSIKQTSLNGSPAKFSSREDFATSKILGWPKNWKANVVFIVCFSLVTVMHYLISLFCCCVYVISEISNMETIMYYCVSVFRYLSTNLYAVSISTIGPRKFVILFRYKKFFIMYYKVLIIIPT